LRHARYLGAQWLGDRAFPVALVLDGNAARGFAYVAVTLVGCAVAGLLGLIVARAVT
jgi:hypothetical protein